MKKYVLRGAGTGVGHTRTGPAARGGEGLMSAWGGYTPAHVQWTHKQAAVIQVSLLISVETDLLLFVQEYLMFTLCTRVVFFFNVRFTLFHTYAVPFSSFSTFHVSSYIYVQWRRNRKLGRETPLSSTVQFSLQLVTDSHDLRVTVGVGVVFWQSLCSSVKRYVVQVSKCHARQRHVAPCSIFSGGRSVCNI